MRYARKYVQVQWDTSWVDIELDAGATIGGLLVLPDGTPTAGRVEVMSRTSGNGWGHPIEDGTFRWEGLSDGEYVLQASSNAGTVEKRVIVVRDGRSVEDVRLVVKPGGEVSGSITGLGPGERVELVVTGPSGRALRPRLFGTPAYGNGIYSVRGIPGSATIKASTSRGRRLKRDVVLNEEGETIVDLDFTGQARITGVVTMAGQPLNGVDFLVVPTDRLRPSAIATTNKRGQYIVSGLAAGPHVIRVRTGQSFDVVVVHNTTFDFELPYNSLAGSVVLEGLDTSMEGLEANAEARISLVPVGPELRHFKLQQRVLSDGTFRFDGLNSGEYTVRVSADGFQQVSRRIYVAGRGQARFVLHPIPLAEKR